jgi:transcriptional regulator GlxA family with amidase domain
MLSDTSYSVGEIEDCCGFNSVSHFSRAFRNRIGM